MIRVGVLAAAEETVYIASESTGSPPEFESQRQCRPHRSCTCSFVRGDVIIAADTRSRPDNLQNFTYGLGNWNPRFTNLLHA